MRVFHGSVDVVRRPEIRNVGRRSDFGVGFYVTTSRKQAEQWTARRAKLMRRPAYVSEYELDTCAMRRLNVLSFEMPPREWVRFVMANRTQEGFLHSHDVVYGSVADDRVYASFALYESGVIGIDALIAELRTYRLVDQYLLHTRRSLGIIDFISFSRV